MSLFYYYLFDHKGTANGTKNGKNRLKMRSVLMIQLQSAPSGCKLHTMGMTFFVPGTVVENPENTMMWQPNM